VARSPCLLIPASRESPSVDSMFTEGVFVSPVVATSVLIRSDSGVVTGTVRGTLVSKGASRVLRAS
jgi:hypothetical protein